MGSRPPLRPRRPLYRSAGALVYPSLVLESASVWGAHRFPESHPGSTAGIHNRMGLPKARIEERVPVVDPQPSRVGDVAVNLPERTGLPVFGIASLGGSALASSRSSGHRIQMRIVSRSG